VTLTFSADSFPFPVLSVWLWAGWLWFSFSHGQRFLFLPPCTGQLWGPHTFLFIVVSLSGGTQPKHYVPASNNET